MAVQPAPTTGSIQMPGLLRLPLELRIQIYRYLIPIKCIIEISHPRFKYTISTKGTLGLDIAGIDIEDDASNSDDSCSEQGEQALSNIGTLDKNLSIWETEGGDPESGLLEETHIKDVADFDGCTNSAYEIDWDQVTTSWGTDRKKNSIFLVCKQISDEALDVMYGENAFRHYLHAEGDLCLKRNFTDANRQRMRMLLLTAEHRSWIGEITPDIAVWSSMIPTLNILRLVAEQPVQETYWNAPPLEKEMKSWFMFMRAFLNCFHHLLEGKLLEVDFNGKTETGEVVKECMLGGYREVRCRLSGDLMFRRGPFSYNSGYWDDDDRGFGSWDA
ncbi:hypothetical protein LSUB1_G004140 [Lachnellula subtilissima]|uniref:F-box domain-containing protein n=1 Tax=Lachnellula subtilissima TaxID=602034 RepID=A0A8H8RU60_9HELO|nr:hypothetical protein LSUB1_G004140 [Lachnellula subtilissima]